MRSVRLVRLSLMTVKAADKLVKQRLKDGVYLTPKKPKKPKKK